MRSFFALSLSLFLGLLTVPIPPAVLFFIRVSDLGLADPNLATGLLFGVPIGVIPGLVAAFSVRRIGSLHGAGAAILAFVSGVVAGTAATTATYLSLPIYPASNIQGPFWIFHPGIYVGLLSASIVAVSLGQLAGPWKSDAR